MFKKEILKALPVLFAAKDLSSFIGGRRDDSTVNGSDSKQWALASSSFVEGTHFPPEATPQEVAGKVLAAGLSNLAGSACRPRWAMVCLCLREGLGGKWAVSFSKDLEKKALEFGVGISVNDVVASKSCTSVMVTVAGEPLPGGPILRDGGNYGDVLVVTGELGGSLAGRHLAPVPRVREIQLLMDFCAKKLDGPDAFPTALVNISDGLAMDLFLMTRESKTGAVLEADKVPISREAEEMSKSGGWSALEHALNDSEDYELLIALPPRVWNAFKKYLASPEGMKAAAGLAPFTRVGNLSSVLHLRLLLGNGTMTHLEPMGNISSRKRNAVDDTVQDTQKTRTPRPNPAPPGKRQENYTKESRIAALRMIASGHKADKVAEELKISEEVIHGWIAECTIG